MNGFRFFIAFLIFCLPMKDSGMTYTLGTGSEVTVCVSADSTLNIIPIAEIVYHGHIKCSFAMVRNGDDYDILVTSASCVQKCPIGSNPCKEFKLKEQESGSVSIFADGCIIEVEPIILNQQTTYAVYIPDDNNGLVSNTIYITEGDAKRVTKTALWLIVSILLADVFIFVFLAIAHRRKLRKERINAKITPLDAKQFKTMNMNSVTLFGPMTIFNGDGVDISCKMSPMLRELFSIILVNTPEGGISINDLRQNLWPDKSEESARNNRAVYITRLKKLLEENGNGTLVRRGNMISYESGNTSVDYLIFNRLINDLSISTPDCALRMLNILSRGRFLENMDAPWADRYKNLVSDIAIEKLDAFLQSFKTKDNPSLVNDVCDALFLLDSMDEIALKYKCIACKEMGRHNMAKEFYDSFAKEYSTLYGEAYRHSFTEIMSN